MSNERTKTEYVCYLMNRAHIDAEGSNGYSTLCLTMMDIPFLPWMVMDENRCSECRELRHEFAEEYDEDVNILDREYSETGTMLELILVMAEKMQYELSDSIYNAGTGAWFELLLENLGLNRYTNEVFEVLGNRTLETNEVVDILTAFNYRTYGWDGQGGMFPLRLPHQDQRYVELIIQMNNYIEENYDIC